MGGKNVPTSDEGDDERLLKGIRAGTPDWPAIYGLNRERMHRAAARRLRGVGPSVAGVSPEDIVQQAMREMMQSGLPRDVEGLDRLLSFMLRVVWRRADDACQGPKARVEALPDEGSAQEPTMRGEEEAVEDELLYEQVISGFDRLSEREQYVMREHVMNGRTQSDVAGALGLTDARVRQLRDSGVTKLARFIGPLHE